MENQPANNHDLVNFQSFDIGLRDGILDEKHLNNMGMAIWLYAWLIRRVTVVKNGYGFVLGGSPIKHEMVQQSLGINRAKYVRWLSTLVEHGYIEPPTHAPYGLIIKITKGKKTFKKGEIRSYKNVTPEASGVTNMQQPGVTNLSKRSYKNVTPNIRDSKENIYTHKKNSENQKQELLEIVNKITGRKFRTLPERGVKKTLDAFSLSEIELALTALVADTWHKERLSGLSIDYLIRSTTIDRFVPEEVAPKPVVADEELEDQIAKQQADLQARNARMRLAGTAGGTL